jgi:hypothetical protein
LGCSSGKISCVFRPGRVRGQFISITGGRRAGCRTHRHVRVLGDSQKAGERTAAELSLLTSGATACGLDPCTGGQGWSAGAITLALWRRRTPQQANRVGQQGTTRKSRRPKCTKCMHLGRRPRAARYFTSDVRQCSPPLARQQAPKRLVPRTYPSPPNCPSACCADLHLSLPEPQLLTTNLGEATTNNACWRSSRPYEDDTHGAPQQG